MGIVSQGGGAGKRPKQQPVWEKGEYYLAEKTYEVVAFGGQGRAGLLLALLNLAEAATEEPEKPGGRSREGSSAFVNTMEAIFHPHSEELEMSHGELRAMAKAAFEWAASGRDCESIPRELAHLCGRPKAGVPRGCGGRLEEPTNRPPIGKYGAIDAYFAWEDEE